MDEADYLLLDYAVNLTNVSVVALSATSFSPKMLFEQEYLIQHGFECIDSKIDGFIDENTATDAVSVDQFMENSVGFAKLIFATDSDLFPSEHVTKTNCRDLALLKVLTQKDVLLITECELTRGVDYRVAEGTKGISLLVMSKSANLRAYV